MIKKFQNSTEDLTQATGRYELPPDFDPDTPSREGILAVVRDAADTLDIDGLALKLGLELPVSVGLERRVRAMERDGQVLIGADGKIRKNMQTGFIAGRVLGHRDGFGFLQRADGQPDLFLSPREMAKVLHGDRVLVRIVGEYRGKPDASIVEVTERHTSKLVGRFLRERGTFIVVPEDQRIKHDILIPPGEQGGAEPGQVVTVQITQQPERHRQPLGRVTEVLGEIDDPGMEIEIAVRKFDVPVDFSEAALKQAARIPAKVKPAEYKGRVDLRDVPFITIDGEDARDFDDAVYCEEVDIGTGKRRRMAWRLLVAIADVSHYVRSGDALDADALERGTSVYFPRRVIPMLPETLSNGICSLNPSVDRLVMVCDMVVLADGPKSGTVSAYQFYEAVIHSHARTTYTDIWSALQQPTGPAAQQIQHVLGPVQNLYALYRLLAERRTARGAIDFDTVETKIICNPLGRIERIEPLVRNDAHKLIEECMLVANTCAADFIARNRRNGLYRLHDGPTPPKLEALREYLRSLGLTLEGGEEPTSADYAKVVAAARGRPDFAVIQTMCLRSMQQAIYSPERTGHFGLSYPLYAHFTSPIRRYPDLLVHRVIKSILKGERYVPAIEDEPGDAALPASKRDFARWERLGALLSARERRADEASKDVEAWLKCWFVKEHVGEEYSGKISGVTSFGLFVTLDTLYVEGLVHVSELGADYFQYNEILNELRGERTGIRYRLTDPVQVQVARVDLEARRIEFRLVKGTGYKALKAAESAPEQPERHIKKAATAKPEALKGTTASQRRATLKQAGRDEKRAVEKSAKSAKTARSPRGRRR
ncbi:ribonuclease R [Alcaligenes sp. SDU_A2]|uniref:ribonuclease R n=1 Tax=Alcaligenes sp. SDU_A2 TaxID=3136634 RepID=UPI002BB63AF7|nr:ribonuclease R [Alcaligenes sp.]HRL28121.1 ribonuclease R [Alcaligenes sp.]